MTRFLRDNARWLAGGFLLTLFSSYGQTFYIAEYKRRQSAPGVKITKKNFGRDRRYPITNRFRDRD